MATTQKKGYAMNESRPNIGDVLTLGLFGTPARFRVLRVYRAGTMDVEHLASGNCFRVTGLGWL